jgi:hypothetical protein
MISSQDFGRDGSLMIPNYEFNVAGETAQKTLLSELQGQFYNTTHKNDWFNMDMSCIV